MSNLNKSDVIFIEEPHSYFLGNIEIQGLTTLLSKHGITANYNNINSHVLQNACDRGTEIHKQTEAFDNFGIIPTHEWAKPYMDLKLNVIESEFLVNYKTIVATKIDLILDDYSVGDKKTCAKIDLIGTAWQCSVGAYLLEKQCNVIVPNIFCIHLREGKAKKIPLERIPNNLIEDLLFSEENKLPFILPNENSLIIEDELKKELFSILVQEKEFEDKKKQITERLLLLMEENNVKSIKNELFNISYIQESTKRTFDSKTCILENPEMNKYFKESKVKSSIRIKLL